MSKVFEAPEDAYFEFFRADAAQDAEAWAAVMSYPHTRVSAAGRSPYYETPEDYAARASWTERVATGWVRSVGVDPVRIHESADKVHLAGGLDPLQRRGRADPAQSRHLHPHPHRRFVGHPGALRTDSFTEGEEIDSSAPVGVVAAHLENWVAGDVAAATETLVYPFTDVGVGRVHRHVNASEVADSLYAEPPRRVDDIQSVREGRQGIVAAATWQSEQGTAFRAVFLVARQEADWRIAAASIIAPTG